MTGEETTVGLTHDSKRDLSDVDVLALVRGAIDRVGGIGRFVRPGDTVLLKPNQTLWFLAEDGVTTDPRVVAAVVRLCKEAGASHITVGDSSGGDLQTKRVLEATGIDRLAKDAGADEVVGFEDLDQERVEIEAGGRRVSVQVPKAMLDAQVVINLPKAKTHFEDPISCALKNWVGVIYQKQRPEFMSNPFLYEATVALHKRIPAQLTVVDALWAGQGNGPASNDAFWMGCVVAGADPVAVDSTVARLMGFDPADLKFAAAGERIGLGTRDASRIRVEGPAIESVAFPAQPTKPGFDHLPIRVLQGEGVDFAGSLGHVKSIGDVWQKYGIWEPVIRIYGRPTFMIGRIDDPDFERHVEEGPYFVVDDAAHERYKSDPRVTFIPGHPATHNIFPHIFDRLHVGDLGEKAVQLAGVFKRLEGWFHQPSWKPRREERAREPTR